MKQSWMKTVWTGCLVVATSAALSMEPAPDEAQAAPTNNCTAAEDAEPRVAVDLVDGARIVGTPSAKRLNVTSLMGPVQVPFSSIERVVFDADKGPAVVILINEDRLSGEVDLDFLRMETLFGTVEISRKYIKRIAAIHTPGGRALQSARGRLSHGVEIQYADPEASPVHTRYRFWIQYELNVEKMTFSANWGYENGGGENGVMDLPVVPTSTGWTASGMALQNNLVRFEQTQGELHMDWGQRIEKRGLQLKRVVWPMASEGDVDNANVRIRRGE